jgi:hypothetical protein
LDPILNVDRLIRLMRSRLEARAKASRTGQLLSEPQAADAREIDALLELVTGDDVPDRELKRALIGHILTEHFGPALRNEPRFREIADRVTETLESDPAGDALIAEAIKDLRAAVRA